MKLRRITQALTVALVAGVAVVAVPAAAQAAVRPCNTQLTVVDTDTSTWDEYHSPAPADLAIVQGPSGSCNLQQGASTTAVRAIQNAMKRCYGESGLVVDGIFGAGTRAALIRTQAKVGTSRDGIYGPATGSRMVWPTTRNWNEEYVGCRAIYRSYFYA
jgi:peptidoglycan hydrolase-like protein with peptidoglycan-binding domain